MIANDNAKVFIKEKNKKLLNSYYYDNIIATWRHEMSMRYIAEEYEKRLIQLGVDDIGEFVNEATREKIKRLEKKKRLEKEGGK